MKDTGTKAPAPVVEVKPKPEGYTFGRPTKYDPKYCEMLIEHMGQGMSFESFAGLIGVTRKLLYDWEKAHPSFLHAKRLGTDKSLCWWESQGQRGLWSTKDGPNLNTTNFIWQMKNRFGWKDKSDAEIAAIQDNTEVLKQIPVQVLLEAARKFREQPPIAIDVKEVEKKNVES